MRYELPARLKAAALLWEASVVEGFETVRIFRRLAPDIVALLDPVNIVLARAIEHGVSDDTPDR